jgi:hypothetical protein
VIELWDLEAPADAGRFDKALVAYRARPVVFSAHRWATPG